MIEIGKIRWKNILSFGNSMTELSFEDGKITLVLGENGNGKSAIYEALFFVLYGKPFRKIKKGGLVNSINGKDLVVEIEIKKSGKNYLVRRGIKPDIFEIYVDGTLRPQPSPISSYQEYLEFTVLQMDEKTFKQSVILGSTAYVPFMQLSAGERRIVVEDFLNVGIYSVMLQKSKIKISVLAQQIRDIESDLHILKVKMDMKKDELERVSGKNEEAISSLRSETDKLKEKIELESSLMKDLDDQILKFNIEELRSSSLSVKKKIDETSRSISNLSYAMSQVEKEFSFIHDNDECPTCSQVISENFKESRKSDLEERKLSLENEKIKLDLILSEFRSEDSSLTAKLDDFQSRYISMRELTVKVNSLKEALDKSEINLNFALTEMSVDTQAIKKEISEIGKAGKMLAMEKVTKEKERSHYELISEELKDGGIKNKIVRDYLPSINRLIKRYLEILEFPVSFSFDENFDETIRSRGKDDFSYGNFSNGERLRLDLALLFTWREITRIKSSAYCNILILDEIGDSSLDAAGFDAFMKILHSDREKQSVLIISHKPQGISSQVDRIIEVEKKGFSSFGEIIENSPHEQLL